MMFRPAIALVFSASLLAACGNDAETGDQAAAPEPVLTPAPEPTTAPDGTALVEGRWEVNENPQGGVASFGADGDPSLAINCERISGTVTMDIASSSQTPEAWRLDAGGESARVDMAPIEGGLSAEIEPGLAIFHAFSNPGEVVKLTSPLGETMQFPTHPGISRVLDACS